MGELLGYLLTWTSYGTWLPGDARGWVDRHRTHGDVMELPNAPLESHCRKILGQAPFVLDGRMRAVVAAAIRQICEHSQWYLHALGVRSNHVHVVVTAPDCGPAKVMGVLKVASSKALGSLVSRKRCWTSSGSRRYLRTQDSLEAAVRYVTSQDESLP
jgi:REP element-mobilizing transposase RayT